MTVNLPQDVLLIPDWKFPVDEDEKWRGLFEDWVSELMRAIEDNFRLAYDDITTGKTKFLVFKTQPNNTDLEEGQFGIFAHRVYTNVDGTIYVLDAVLKPTGGYRDLPCKITKAS